MNSVTPILQYCNCSADPVLTGGTFCDECGSQFRDSPNGADDVFEQGQTVERYVVSARSTMWAELQDAEGSQYRFWPTASTRPTPPADASGSTTVAESPAALDGRVTGEETLDSQVDQPTSSLADVPGQPEHFLAADSGSLLGNEPEISGPVELDPFGASTTVASGPPQDPDAQPVAGADREPAPSAAEVPTEVDHGGLADAPLNRSDASDMVTAEVIQGPECAPTGPFASSAERAEVTVHGASGRASVIDPLPAAGEPGEAVLDGDFAAADHTEQARTATTDHAAAAVNSVEPPAREDAPGSTLAAAVPGHGSQVGRLQDSEDSAMPPLRGEPQHSAQPPSPVTGRSPGGAGSQAEVGAVTAHGAGPGHPGEVGADDHAGDHTAVDGDLHADAMATPSAAERAAGGGHAAPNDENGLGSPAEVPPGASVPAPVDPVDDASPGVQPPPGLMEAPRHYAFIPFTPTVLGGVTGRLEPARPRLFSGLEAKSLRDVLLAEPDVGSAMPGRVLGWLVQCAQAMKSAHDDGILVNSFTLDTVFVDFSPSTDRPERIAISTALFAAPFEQAQPVAGYSPLTWGTPGPDADFYQVGALLRDLLGLRLDINGDPQDEQALVGKPMPLVRLALRLMGPDAEARPADADALKRALVEAQRALEAQHAIDVAGWTDVGLRREHNEDAFGFLQYEEQAGKGSLSTTLLVVCDGVGGAAAGEEASRLAVREILSSMTASSSAGASVPERLEQAILQANHRILNIQQEHRGAGCTVVAVYIQGRQYWVAHAGDSRAYKCVDGVISALTADHSWTAQQVRKGLMTPAEASVHENAHMIYRSLGERERLEIDIQPPTPAGFPLEPRTRFLLCSDGVTDVLSDAELAALLSTVNLPVRQLARQCVDHANAAGGPDNITALVAAEEIKP